MKRVLRPGGLYIFVEHVAAKGIHQLIGYTKQNKTTCLEMR